MVLAHLFVKAPPGGSKCTFAVFESSLIVISCHLLCLITYLFLKGEFSNGTKSELAVLFSTLSERQAGKQL